MIQIWSDNNSVIADIENCRKDKNELIFKLYDKTHDNCTEVVLTKQKLKDLAKFIDMVVENIA